MKLSDLWPRAAGDASPVIIADAGPSPRVKLGRPAPKPLSFPSTLVECQILEEKLGRDAIRLEANIRLSESDRRDETWGYRARAALKHMNRDRQALMIHMKKLRVAEREKDPAWNTYEKLLLRLLAGRVPRELMDECKQLAQAQLDQFQATNQAESSS